MDVLIVTALYAIGFMIIGSPINHVLANALFAGIMNIIPYIGHIIGIVIGLIIGIAINIQTGIYDNILPQLIYMLIIYISVQILDGIFFSQ